ncbi:MAG TPA: gamma-butyrobetaine hydroxylase-like domain-containing protein [Rhizomicrobium sp.]|nr:gamma-butyrobetaine hydroxylase-like domain-containing protein [Rhizomicrobium sp.]
MASWPTELRLNPEKDCLTVRFEDGTHFALGAETLRVESPSAEVRGHGGASKPPPVTGKEDVKIARLEPVGNYAVRIVFDDGHDSGLYSWDYLAKLGSRNSK